MEIYYKTYQRPIANLDEDSDWETILQVQSQSQAKAQHLEHDEILSDGMLRQMHALEWKNNW